MQEKGEVITNDRKKQTIINIKSKVSSRIILMFESLCERYVATIIDAHPHHGGRRNPGMGFLSVLSILSHGV